MQISFPNDNHAYAVFSSLRVPGTEIIRALALPLSRPVLLLHGGAGRLSENIRQHIQKFLIAEVAEIAANQNFTIMDGGTLAGVMQMMGEEYAAVKGRSPLIGVCPAACVTWPGKEIAPDLTPLEPHHTHFVLTPGDDWGAETATMFSLAAALSMRAPSLALLINGGAVSRAEVRYNVAQGREVLVIAGSGRLADALAAAMRGEALPDEELDALVRQGRFKVFDIDADVGDFTAYIRARLCGA